MNDALTLTRGNLGSALLKFSIPFLLASLLQAFYGAADLFIVGQFDNAAGVSAVATGSQVMQTVTGVILGLTTGGTILIGQYLGAKKDEDAAVTVGTIACIFAVFAVILTLVMTALSRQFTLWMQTPEASFEATCDYIFICACGVPFIVGYNAISGIFRGMGDSKSPLVFVAIACVINILGDFVLVALCHMGAAGAALATTASQGISFIAAVSYLWRRGFPFPFSKKHFKIDLGKAGKIFTLGAPIALQDGLINISFLIITAIINAMGLTASASVGVVEKVIVFVFLPISAFASAVSVATAQNSGAGQNDRCIKSLKLGIAFTLVWGVAFCLFCQFKPELLTRIFTTDAEVVAMSALYMKSYSLDTVVVCFVFCFNAFFSGCGHAVFPMVHSLIATFTVRVPLAFALSLIPGISIYYLGFASPLATLLSLAICAVYLKSGRWKTNTVISRA
ncbi:MAG: MATE family efflux transporter [Eubacterium sp.]|nr:MATE family efflux transporter [Eubacterium sp.]